MLRYFQMWNTGETRAVADLVGDALAYHARPETTDAESLAEVIRASRAADQSLHVFVDAVLEGGKLVNVVGRVRSTTDDIERIRNRVWVFRVDERIREIWRY